MKTIKELQQEAHQIAKDKGFWGNTEKIISILENVESQELIDENMNNIISTKLALIHSELSEALEALRKGKRSFKDIPELNNEKEIEYFKAFVKDTLEDEIADAVIRIFDLCGWLGIDLENHVIIKMAYNKTRPYKHGKTF